MQEYRSYSPLYGVNGIEKDFGVPVLNLEYKRQKKLQKPIIDSSR